MSGRENVLMQLYRHTTRVGEQVSAFLDWREHGAELRVHLLDAVVTRGRYSEDRLGEFELEVRDARSNRKLTRFVGASQRHINEARAGKR